MRLIAPSTLQSQIHDAEEALSLGKASIEIHPLRGRHLAIKPASEIDGIALLMRLSDEGLRADPDMPSSD